VFSDIALSHLWIESRDVDVGVGTFAGIGTENVTVGTGGDEGVGGQGLAAAITAIAIGGNAEVVYLEGGGVLLPS
jgi:hypothetical protein